MLKVSKPRFYGAFGHMFGAQIRVQCTSDNVLVALSITHTLVCLRSRAMMVPCKLLAHLDRSSILGSPVIPSARSLRKLVQAVLFRAQSGGFHVFRDSTSLQHNSAMRRARCRKYNNHLLCTLVVYQRTESTSYPHNAFRSSEPGWRLRLQAPSPSLRSTESPENCGGDCGYHIWF